MIMTTPRTLRLVGTATFVACLAIAAACSRQAEPPPPPQAAGPPPPPPAPVAAATDAEQVPLQTRTAELDDSARERAKTIENQRKSLQRARVGFATAGVEELTPEQRQLLEDRIAHERGSRKSLAQEILDQDVKIRDLRAKLESLSKGLPASHVAVAGDRHDRIAMNFLLAQGVPANKAYEVISKLNLEEALIPGFRVWTYYNNGQFGTWVTQGNAAISPADHQKRLRAEVENFRAESAALMQQAAALQESNRKLAQRAETGEAEARAALKAAEESAARLSGASARASTVYYAIGTKKSLEGAKIIDGRLRLMTLDIPDSQPLNLAERQVVTFEPQSYDPKLKRVKRIRVAPTSFVEGEDYSVTALGDVGVELRILNTAKFTKAGHFLVVIE
jgi:Spy/CpxP family protein refolding chaperone